MTDEQCVWLDDQIRRGQAIEILDDLTFEARTVIPIARTDDGVRAVPDGAPDAAPVLVPYDMVRFQEAQ